jgi:membrane associated rhomboid family serine protease
MAEINLIIMLKYLLSLVFLFPLKDDRGRFRSFPYMTVGLIVLNVLVLATLFLVLQVGEVDEAVAETFLRMLLLPVDILEGRGVGALSMITAAFLHGGVWHLIGNMLYLFFFGRKLEDVLGPTKFGLFYLLCVFVSGTVSVIGWSQLPVTQGRVPSLGASGAIMGIVGAYLFLYHGERIRTLVVLGILPIPFTMRMPAWVFILYTVFGDILNGLLEQELQAIGFAYAAVDMFAHLGGVIAGLTCLYFYLPAEIVHYRRQIGEEV